jgi:transglutaminase-like putative cysteine protease
MRVTVRRRTTGPRARCCAARFAVFVATATTTASANAGDGRATLPTAASQPASERSFLFTYAATVNGLAAARSVRVWLPVPPTDDTQLADVAASTLPASASTQTEGRFGNRIVSFALPDDHGGSATFSVTYRIARREIVTPQRCPVPPGAAMSNPDALLRPDARVPVGGEPARVLLAQRTVPADATSAARLLYDVIDAHLQDRQDRPGWGNGDAEWACHSGFGNCTDFHSLFISLARTERLPAVFQIGFPIGPQPAGEVKGYHCWAWYQAAPDQWSPVDISEANLHPGRRAYYFGHLDADRVAFTVGRDLDLVPKQAGPPLNFFVYPYVEEDGRPVPQERIAKSFSYRAVP